MSVQSFTIAELMPELVSGLITYVPNVYRETNGLAEMAQEAPPQLDPKIRVRGKVVLRPIADDIPESSEATLIKDTKFTDEMFTAPEYGKGFAITANDLIRNQSYMAGFGGMSVSRDRAPLLMERVRSASDECINMIKRAADSQVQQLMKTGTVAFSNYATIDFGRDNGNSVTISTANLKWTIANAATMLPLSNIATWTEQVATRGNCGGEEFIVLMSMSAYKAYINSAEYKADSDILRNYSVEMARGVSAAMNINIPNGAVYRGSLLKNPVGPAHIFTYDQTYTNSGGAATNWITTDQVYIIATGNIFQRQPVSIVTMNDFIATSNTMRQALAASPSMAGWLITPEWNKTTSRALVMGIYRKFLTLALTPNKTFAAIVNS